MVMAPFGRSFTTEGTEVHEGKTFLLTSRLVDGVRRCNAFVEIRTMKTIVMVVVLCASAYGQTVSSGRGVSSGFESLGVQYGVEAVGENAYCPKASGTEMTQGTPTWGATDGVATLPAQCMYTGMDATPASGSVVSISTAAALTSHLAGMTSANCGEIISLAAGVSFVGPFTLPAVGCTGSNWIYVVSSDVPIAGKQTGNSNFPAEHVQATPCIAGISNDATNEYNAPGYPSYSCPGYPTVLTAQLTSSTNNSAPLQFASGATHYRLIGLEVTKNASTIMGGGLVSMAPGGATVQGADHVIFDRDIVHGTQLTIAGQQSTGLNDETQAGIYADNSQWVALISSWDYDTYCNQVCIDSQAYHAGTGSFQDGPHKIWNSVLASAGESWMFGGGGAGPGTPVSTGIEIRGNVSIKPLIWMIPVNTDPDYPYYAQVKNLGELKNGQSFIYEGNVVLNDWQGPQENQDGPTFLIDPKNQNAKSALSVTFDGTDGVVTATSGSFANLCGGGVYCNVCGGSGSTAAAAAAAGCSPAGIKGNPDYPCPPGGCILYINDSSRADFETQYRFCDGVNGCSQSGMNLNTTARILPYDGAFPAAQTGTAVYSCVPGPDPTAAVHNGVVRFNQFENTTAGIIIGTGKSAYCEDESAGMDTVIIHDNAMIGASVEMTNGTGPYEASTGVAIGNGQNGSIVNAIEIGHNDIIPQNNCGANGGCIGGMVSQNDDTDVKYLTGFYIHDNVGPAPIVNVEHSQGSDISAVGGVPLTSYPSGGGTGLTGLANSYQTDSCATTLDESGTLNDAAGDLAGGIALNAVAAGTAFTFTPALSSYFVTKNGQNLILSAASTTGFTTCTSPSAACSLVVGDSISVRDLTSCNYRAIGNLTGELQSEVNGAGGNQSPYNSGSGVGPGAGTLTGNVDLTSGFPGIFSNWPFVNTYTAWPYTGANFMITSPTYIGTASDAATRQATGKNPGADLTTLASLVSVPLAQAHSIFYYALAFSSSSVSLSSTTGVGGAGYEASLMNLLGTGGVLGGYGASGGGASPYKSFWSTSAPSPAGSGIILGRDGTISGPFLVQTVSRTSGVASFNPAMGLDANTVPVVGQTIVLSNFINYGSGSSANDASLNGTCVAVTASANGIVTCNQSGADIASHSPVSTPNHGCTASSDGWYHCSSLTYVPLTAGSSDSYTFAVNAKDGAFQTASATVAITVK